MASQQPLPGAAYVKLELDLSSSAWNTTTPTYTDVTDDLRWADRLTWERGRDAEWDAITAGTFGGALNNRARSYDPASNASIVGRRPARITCYYPNPSSTAYVQMVGLAESFEPKYPAVGLDSVTSFEGVDQLTTLYLSKIASAPILGTTAQAALAALANIAGIPVAQQSFAVGTWAITGGTFEQTDVGSAMQMIANSQVQMLFSSKSGVLTTLSPFQSNPPVATFGDGGGAELKYADIKGGVGGSGTYTVVTLHQSGKEDSGTSLTAPATVNTSAADVTKFGRIVLDLSCCPTQFYSTAAASWAARVATPGTYWFRELVIRPMADPANLFPIVLGAEIGQRYTLVRRPLGGGSAITQTSVLRSIRHEVGGGDWVVTWGFAYR